MPPDLEPASALARRICACFGFEPSVLVVGCIEADRAAVREAALREAIEVIEAERRICQAYRTTDAELREAIASMLSVLDKLRKTLTEKVSHG